jgi:hypothetical protein
MDRRIKRCVLLEEPSSRIVERYQQTGIWVGVNVDGEIPTGGGEARYRPELVRTEWTCPIRKVQPGGFDPLCNPPPPGGTYTLITPLMV